MRRERDRAGLGDERAVVVQGAEKRFELGLEAVDLGDDALERRGIERVFDDDEAELVELRRPARRSGAGADRACACHSKLTFQG